MPGHKVMKYIIIVLTPLCIIGLYLQFATQGIAVIYTLPGGHTIGVSDSKYLIHVYLYGLQKADGDFKVGWFLGSSSLAHTATFVVVPSKSYNGLLHIGVSCYLVSLIVLTTLVLLRALWPYLLLRKRRMRASMNCCIECKYPRTHAEKCPECGLVYTFNR